uniref:Uncharacterized protein n=1 Tax=viral metagenome TaxID=1070528 RepID=A0A6M3JMP0_9ZZZZ
MSSPTRLEAWDRFAAAGLLSRGPHLAPGRAAEEAAATATALLAERDRLCKSGMFRPEGAGEPE